MGAGVSLLYLQSLLARPQARRLTSASLASSCKPTQYDVGFKIHFSLAYLMSIDHQCDIVFDQVKV